MTSSGYIKLYRTIKDQPWYQDSEAVHLFMHLLIEASHTERQYIVKGDLITIQPGQFLTGRKQLSLNTGINESKVQRLLKLFEKCGQIEQQTNNTNRCISIVNWDKYQSGEQPVNNERTTSEQPVNNERTQNKNVKNNKNEKNGNNYGDGENFEQWIEDMKADELFRDQVAIRHKITGAEFENMLAEFFGQKKALGELTHGKYSDFRRNFLFWIPKNLELKKLKNDTGKTRNHANLIDEETARRVFARVTEGDF